MTHVKEYLVGAFARMVRAYLILLGITFGELAAGAFLFGVPHPATAAAVVALVDLLPVLGTGIVLIPWAAVALLQGEVFLGAGLAVLYGVIALVRNLLEPKILGRQMGLHPLAALVSIYVGGRLFGLLGLFAQCC